MLEFCKGNAIKNFAGTGVTLSLKRESLVSESLKYFIALDY